MSQPDDADETRAAGGSSPAPADASASAGAETTPAIVTGNKRELAAFLRVSIPTVDGYIADGCPILEGGSNGRPYIFDFRAVWEWRRARDEARELADAHRRQAIADEQGRLFGDELAPADPELEKLSPKARAEIIRSQRELLLLQERQKSLVRVDAVVVLLAEAFASLKQSILTLPDALQRQFGLSDVVAAAFADAVADRLNDAVDAAQLAVAKVGGDAQKAA